MTLTLILFTVANIVLAFIDAHKILKSKTINHVVNAAIYIALVAVPYFIFHNYFLIAALLFNRLIFFNMFLSLFRGLPAFYMPKHPASFVDRLANSVFGTNGKKMYAVYAGLFIVLTVISFI